MIKLPVRREVTDPSKQPKSIPPQKAIAKPPCDFCRETRAKVRSVVETVLGKFKKE